MVKNIQNSKKSQIKILLLENVHSAAVEAFRQEGYQVEEIKEALSEKDLICKIKDVHALGIRSKTRITERVLKEAKHLLGIGCFCIGTDQVDIAAAEAHGIPVFNSPFSNTRSVAELIIAEIIILSRRLGEKSAEMHKGIWDKSARDCHEIRGKILGIVGYGHIGSQLSILAESLGMQILYYDIASVLALGNSQRCERLDHLLSTADFVSLHVPNTEHTNKMISHRELQMMKKGSYLLNASRGNVVEISALVESLQNGHLAGAAVDVFPTEPESNSNSWQNDLQKCPNIFLTPHVGGSTEEAQYSIGIDVANKMIQFLNTGNTSTAVNFPSVALPRSNLNSQRIITVHKNDPGVLKRINGLLADVNIAAQVYGTKSSVGYLMLDCERESAQNLAQLISVLPTTLRTRVLS